MHRMQHENVVRLYGVVLDTKAVMLVSELAPCGSLLECLQSTAWREQPNSISTLCEFALQIAKGMHYLATQRLIHRDLAARNVLVSSPTKVRVVLGFCCYFTVLGHINKKLWKFHRLGVILGNVQE